MKTLNLKNIEIVTKNLSGKRLETFLVSLNLIQASLEAGGWVPGASRSSDKGFSQGCGKSIEVPPRPKFDDPANPMYEPRYEVEWCLRSAYATPSDEQIQMVLNDLSEKELKKVSKEMIVAWCALCQEKREAVKWLDASRPLPVVTAIGLSPKVTKTLKDMNLDLDLPSIKLAKIDFRMVPKLHMDPKGDKFGQEMIGRDGEVIMEREYFVSWSEGILHGQSRFTASMGQCEACGKGIPSGRFVPIEAFDKKRNNLVSMWLGCDCAKNIFGVKDIGLKKN